MKKVRLNNLYESSLPPEDINVLWADIDENTNELRAIHRYNKSKGEWEPSMVSVDFMNPDDNQQESDKKIVYRSGDLSFPSFTLIDTTNNYKHHCLIIQDWENLPESKEDAIHSEVIKRGSTLVSIYDRDWSSSNKWTDNNPVINGVGYRLVEGIFGHFAGDDGFIHKFHAMSPAQYEQFKTGMTVSSSTSDKFSAMLIIRKI